MNIGNTIFFFWRRTQQTFIALVINFLVFIFTLAAATVIYTCMYQRYVPHISHAFPIYFDYDTPIASTIINPDSIITQPDHPTAIVALHIPEIHDQSILTDNQWYRISVDLTLPETKNNAELGNFMVSIGLFDMNSRKIATSTRPASMILYSEILKFFKFFLCIIPEALGYTHDGQRLSVTLFERYREPATNGTHHALLSLSSSKIHIYSAQLRIEATFIGMVYFMYHWKILTALICIPFIAIWILIGLYVLTSRTYSSYPQYDHKRITSFKGKSNSSLTVHKRRKSVRN